MKKWISALLALTMVFSLAACSGEQEPTGSGSSPDPGTSPTGAATPSPAQTPEPSPEGTPDPAQGPDPAIAARYLEKAEDVTVTGTHVIFTDDSGGGELSIEKGPKNVAVLFGSLTSLWYEAGGTVQLAVGGKSAVTTYKEQIGRDITRDEGVTVVAESPSGSNWDVEAIIAARPDLIICSMGLKGYATISGPAGAAGIPVIGIDYNGVQDYLKWFKVFCNLNGKPELWDSVADATARQIIRVVSGVPQVEKAPAAVILVVSSNTLKAYTFASQPGVILSELGGVNLADPNSEGTASSVEIDMENLYALDPDIILLSEFGGTTLDTLKETYKDDPVWQSLRAVKEDRLYSLEISLFHNKANGRYGESYLTMAQLLYPGFEL